MEKKYLTIKNNDIDIPVILWGEKSDRLLIEVHGNLSNKEDTVISMMAKRACVKGYQCLSFDLPMHGQRTQQSYDCNPQNCISDLKAVYHYAQNLADQISLFACSLGAYFSLLAYHDFEIKQSLFLSPVVNMEKIIRNMMDGFGVSEERLKNERQISLPIGQTLDWDYFTYVREHPVDFEWNVPTAVLYGSRDEVTEWSELSAFVKKYRAELKILENGEHFFHTEEQLRFFDEWSEQVLF